MLCNSYIYIIKNTQLTLLVIYWSYCYKNDKTRLELHISYYGEKCFQCVAFVNIGMRYSGHLPPVDDASVVGDAFVYDTSVDNASVNDEHTT